MKIRYLFLAPFLALAFSGCGGSSSGSNLASGSAIANGAEYMGSLSDGTQMMLEFFDAPAGSVSGEFIMGTETGEFAFQMGEFRGTYDGNTFNAEAETLDGKTFTLSGTRSGQNLLLTRSDVPGQTLTFTLQVHVAVTSRAAKSCALATGNNSNLNLKGTIDDVPYASSAWAKEYRGTLDGHNASLFIYNGGSAALSVNMGWYGGNLMCSFSGISIGDVGSKTLNAISALAALQLRDIATNKSKLIDIEGAGWKLVP